MLRCLGQALIEDYTQWLYKVWVEALGVSSQMGINTLVSPSVVKMCNIDGYLPIGIPELFITIIS